MKATTTQMLKALAAQYEVQDPCGELLLDEIGTLSERLADVSAKAAKSGDTTAVRLELDVRSQYLRALKQLEMQQQHVHSSRRPKRGRPALASV